MLIGVAMTCVLSIPRAKLRTVNSSDGDDVQEEIQDEQTVLPWWHNPVNLIVIVIAVAVLAAGTGFVMGERNATPDPNSVDIGYLQDMRAHHEQAVEMALIYLGKQATDPNLRLIAKEIAFGQAVDIGRMIQLLRKAGVTVAFSVGPGDASLVKNIPYDAAQAVAFGLPENEALKGMTLYPAQMAGVADHLGSIEAGKDATFFVADGDILDIRTNVKRMWIAGKEISLENRHTRLYEKYRHRPQPK